MLIIYCLKILILKQHGFELHRSTYMWGFFNKYIAGPLYQWTQPTRDGKQYFPSTIGNPRLPQANYMHWSVPFYIKDLNICRLWYPQESEPIPHGCRETNEVSGKTKVVCGFSSMWGVSAFNPRVVQESTWGLKALMVESVRKLTLS